MRYFLVLNPGARSGRSKKKFRTIFKLLDERKIRYDYKITDNLKDAYSFSVEGNRAGYDVVVAVGGDGTINKVLNGFYNAQGGGISKAKLGIIYTGTSPDFCKSYHIPINLEEAVKTVLDNKSSKVQIGRIEFARTFNKELDGKALEESTETTSGYFGCCANFGIGPLLASKANSGIRKIFGDFMGTFLALMSILISYHPNSFTIKRDARLETIERVFSFSTGKTFYIASGIKVHNNLTEGDNRFYNLIVKNISIRHWLSVLKKMYSGKPIVSNDIVSLNYYKSVEVYGNNAYPEVEFDGDVLGFLPCKIEMAEDKLDLICEPL